MKRRLFLIYTVLILMFTGGGTKVVPAPETDAKAIVPEYVVDAKELIGLGIKESAGKVFAISDFWFRPPKARHNMYLAVLSWLRKNKAVLQGKTHHTH